MPFTSRGHPAAPLRGGLTNMVLKRATLSVRCFSLTGAAGPGGPVPRRPDRHYPNWKAAHLASTASRFLAHHAESKTNNCFAIAGAVGNCVNRSGGM